MNLCTSKQYCSRIQNSCCNPKVAGSYWQVGPDFADAPDFAAILWIAATIFTYHFTPVAAILHAGTQASRQAASQVQSLIHIQLRASPFTQHTIYIISSVHIISPAMRVQRSLGNWNGTNRYSSGS